VCSSSFNPISEVMGLALVVVLSLPNEAWAKLGARPVGLLRHNESRFFCNNFVRSVARWDIQRGYRKICVWVTT
jgi:hypothetical protein